ncbi:MAG TPA: EamA family transporter [Candidatus Limnocylindrales bacterium]
MDPWIIGLVAVSAVLHLAWNVRLKTAGDPLRTATIGMLAASVAIVPVGIVVWWIEGRVALPFEGIVLGIASGVVEAAYFILLSAAYRRGDLSVVYPVARGTAPLLAVAFGVGVLGERLGVAGSVGVVLLLVGFLWLQRPWRAIAAARAAGGAAQAAGGVAGSGNAAGGGAGIRAAAADSAILFALATGVMIATYTAIDRVGTRQIDPFPYAAILWATCSAVLVLWVAFVAGGDLLGYGPEAARRAAVGGYLTLAAYLCILVALSVAPLSGVAPLRESATVFAAAWGSVRMGEASGRSEALRRVAASVLIVGGALLLAVGSGHPALIDIRLADQIGLHHAWPWLDSVRDPVWPRSQNTILINEPDVRGLFGGPLPAPVDDPPRPGHPLPGAANRRAR